MGSADFIDGVLFLQIDLINAMLSKWKITINQFFTMNKKYGIIEFIKKDYDFLGMYGTSGMLNAIKEYIADKDALQAGQEVTTMNAFN